MPALVAPIAVGKGGAVLTSNDGAVTWTERDSGSSAWLQSVAFDAGTGRTIAVGEGGAVLTSNDGGVTWTERDSGSSAFLRSVVFDAATGRAIAVGILPPWGALAPCSRPRTTA